jgi:WD40 repeat protein/serine/threonine protein kinase
MADAARDAVHAAAAVVDAAAVAPLVAAAAPAPAAALPPLPPAAAAAPPPAARRGLAPFVAFLSYSQVSGGNQVLVLREALCAWPPASHAAMPRVWFDHDHGVTYDTMHAGVRDSASFVLFLSNDVLARRFCQLEIRAALDAGKPLVFVLERDAAHGGRPVAELLAQGRAHSLSKGGAAPLAEAHFAWLEAALEEAPPLTYHHDAARFASETLAPLATRLGLPARGGQGPAAVAAPFRVRRPLPAAGGACDVLIVSAPLGENQAAFIRVALEARCARRALVVRSLDDELAGLGGGDEAAAIAAARAACVVVVLTTDVFAAERLAASARVRIAAVLAAVARARDKKARITLIWETDERYGGELRFGDVIEGAPRELRDSGLFSHANVRPLRRALREREDFLDWLLGECGAVRADTLGGRLPPPPLPVGFETAPVEETVGEIARLLVGGRGGAGVVGEGVVFEGAASVGVGGAGASAGAAGTPPSKTLLPCRIVATGGLGGAGKTTLATAVVLLRAEVRAAFDDVYWLTLGLATREQLLAKMRMLIDEVGDGEGAAGDAGEGLAGELKTVEAATKRLRELLRARRVLVVLDDAWTRDHFAAFVGAIEGGGGAAEAAPEHAAGGSSLLFTTRNLAVFRRVAEPAAVRALPAMAWARLGHCAAVDTAELAPGPARAFLAAAAGIAPAHAAGLDFARVFAAIGTLPLPLFIVGACARSQLEAGRETEHKVFAAIAGALEAAGKESDGGAADEPPPEHGAWLKSARFRAALLAQNPEAAGKYAPTFAAISLALGALAATDALAFAWLGLFPEGVAVHEAVTAAAWRMESDPSRARALLVRLQAAGLAKLEAAEGAAAGGGAADGVAVMLHDLARDFAAAICASQAGGAAAWHARIIARLAQLIPESAAADGACRPWWRLGEEKKHGAVAAFVAEHLLAYLRAAGLRDEAAALAFRLPWLQFELRRRGALALVDDLERNLERSEETGLLVETLKLSRPGLLIGDGDEAADSLLPGQVVGRVSTELGAKWPATLGALRSECWDWRGPREWIRPVRAYFTAPGGPLKATLEGHTDRVRCVAVLPFGHVVSGSDDKTLRVWNASTGACERVLEGHSMDVTCVAVLPDGRVVSGSDDKTLRVWDASSFLCEHVLEGHSDSVRCVSVLPDGRVVSGSDDDTLRVWDASSGACERVLEGHSDSVVCVAVLPDGHVVSGSDDKTLRVWDASTGVCECVFKGHWGDVFCVAVLPDGRVVSGSRDKTLCVWDASSGTCECVLEGHLDSVRCVSVLPDGRVVSGSDDDTLRVWDASSGECERMLEGRFRGVICVAVLPDGCVVSGLSDTTLRVWDASKSNDVHEPAPEGHSGSVACLAALTGGRIVSGSDDTTLRVWNASSGACEHVLEGHVGRVWCVAALPDGRVVSGSDDMTLRVWDASSGVCERVLEGHLGRVACMAVLPEGRVVSGSDDKTLRVWDASSGVCERVLEGHSGAVWCVAVLPDGRVVSGSDDDTLRVWDAPSGACKRVVRRMDADFASLDPSGRADLPSRAISVELRHSGPLLATSAARIHVRESLTASIAASITTGLSLVCAAASGKVLFLSVVDAAEGTATRLAVLPRDPARDAPTAISVARAKNVLAGFPASAPVPEPPPLIVRAAELHNDRMLPASYPSSLSWSSLTPDVTAVPQRGGMGTVFKARWERRGLDVAVKLLRASELSAAEFSAAASALEREAEALRLASEGGANRFVVAQHGLARGQPTEAWAAVLGDELVLFRSRGAAAAAAAATTASAAAGAAAAPLGELFGLVMAWQPGGSLAELLHGGAVSWAARTPERMLLLEHVAEGVALLHSAQPQMVVHGDIKSENVLLTAGGEPRLGDFGLAEVRKAAATQAAASTARAAAAAYVGGTAAYRAPEMYRTRATLAVEASRSTDVYALATLCWEVLVGERPWEGFNEAERLIELLYKGGNLNFACLPGDVPAELRVLLERGVALDRTARPSARELCEGLRKARELLESGRFDVFLSHAWDGDEHAPATAFVRRALHEQRYRVWVDTDQMGRALGPSMRAGVAASAVFVALVSRKYAASANCMLELRAAHDGGKTIIACLVEPEKEWWPPTSAATDAERELAAAINTREFMFADLRKACAAGGWADPLPGGLRELLDAPTAVRMLLRLVADELRTRGAAAPVQGDAADPWPPGRFYKDSARTPDPAAAAADGPSAAAAGGGAAQLADPFGGWPPTRYYLWRCVACAQRGVLQDNAVAAARCAACQAERPASSADEARVKGELLLEACRDKRAKDAMRLVDDGAAVDSVSKNEGWTPLITASSKGLEAVAARLVEAGATLDVVSNIGWSALMEASLSGHTSIARLLADKGAVLDLVDNHGCSALMHASLNGHTAIVQLLADKAKLDLVNNDGESALIMSCFRAYAEIAQLLAARMDTAALNILDKYGKTALDYAIESGRRKDKVAELAPAAAAIRARGGLTAAELAARK